MSTHRTQRQHTGRALATALCLAVAVTGVFGVPVEAHAGFGDLSIMSPVNSLFAFATEALFTISRVFISLSVFALRMFMEVAAYNGYIDAPPVLVGWYMVRDIANMFFVVALLIIAFGTILGLEQYEWKKALVKLVLAAILINFSRLIIGIFIDASHVATITFLNAAQGAAGGNLVEMLKLEKIMEMAKRTTRTTVEVTENIRWDLFAAGLMAMLFSLIALVAIGAYLVVMIARVVMLWILIILSPLAFVLSAIPQAKTYAEEFWKEVSKYILAAPLMMFFLWLAFATLGNGEINNHVGIGATDDEQRAVYAALDLAGNTQSISLSEATTWENMSAFLIAIGFLFAGLDRVSKLGVVGGSLVSGALNFGKRALEVAAGVTLARYVGAKGKQGLGLAAGYAIQKAPLIGTDKLKRYGKGIRDTWKTKVSEPFRQNVTVAASRALLESRAKVSDDLDKRKKLRAERKKVASEYDVAYSAGDADKQNAASNRLDEIDEELIKVDSNLKAKIDIKGKLKGVNLTGNGFVGGLEALWKGSTIAMKAVAEGIPRMGATATGLRGVAGKANRMVTGSAYAVLERLVEPESRKEERSKKLEKAAKDEEAITEKLSGLSKSGAGRAETHAQSRLENLTKEKELGKNKRILNARAEDYEENGDNERAAAMRAQAQALDVTDLREALKGLTGKELIARAQSNAGELAQLKKIGASSERIAKATNKLFIARTLTKSHAEGAWVMEEANKAIMKTIKMTSTAGMNERQIDLSLDLAENLGSSADTEVAAKRLTDDLGGTDKSQAAVRERRFADKYAVMLGRFDHAGLTGDEIDERTGKVKYVIRGANTGSGTDPSTGAPITINYAEADIEGLRDYMNIAQMKYAPVGSKNRDANGNITGISTKEFDFLVSMFEGKTGQYIAHMQPILRDLKKATGPAARAQLTALYAKLRAGKTSAEAVKALEAQTTP